MEQSPGSYSKKSFKPYPGSLPLSRSLFYPIETDLPFALDWKDTQSFYCPICYSDQYNTIDLPCGDQICVTCFRLTLEFYIENGMVSHSKRVCPICKETIKLKIIKKVLTNEQVDRIKHLLKRKEADKKVAEGSAVYCPLPDCLGYALIVPNCEVLACCRCTVSICSQCHKMYHPTLSCEEYGEEVGDDEFENLMHNRMWKPCPYCTTVVEKMEGCNHMECYSNVCEGINGFCYLCGKGLSHLEDQYQHFGEWGSDSNFCNTVKGIQD